MIKKKFFWREHISSRNSKSQMKFPFLFHPHKIALRTQTKSKNQMLVFDCFSLFLIAFFSPSTFRIFFCCCFAYLVAVTILLYGCLHLCCCLWTCCFWCVWNRRNINIFLYSATNIFVLSSWNFKGHFPIKQENFYSHFKHFFLSKILSLSIIACMLAHHFCKQFRSKLNFHRFCHCQHNTTH